jgi:hypothetical protein
MKSSKKDSTLFLLPLIGLDKNKVFTKYFLTSYIRDFRFPELDNVLILEYSKANPELDELYCFGRVESKDSVLYYYEMPEKYNSDYVLFIEGKFSKFSVFAKQDILEFWGSTKVSLLYGILYKTDYAKLLYLNSLKHRNIDGSNKTNFEYWRIPSLQAETYKN